MLENIKIDVINLKHRRDRLDHARQSMKKILDLNINDVNFFEANYIPENGMLGCAISHFTVLSNFIRDMRYDYQIIFEDDIVFRNEFNLRNLLDDLNKHAPYYDLFQFASWNHTILKSFGKNIIRVCNSVTASGYLIKRDFAPTLLECFSRSINLLRSYHSDNSTQRRFVMENFTIDQLWKPIQLTHNFLTTNPTYGYQMAGYSDIHKRNIDLLS